MVAEVALYGAKAMKPGENAYAQLRMDNASLLLPGDRFIVRQFSPVVTIGGGVVLDATPVARVKSSVALPFLQALNEANKEYAIQARIARRGHDGLTLQELTAETGWRNDMLNEALRGPLQRQHAVRLGDRYVHTPAVIGLKQLLLRTVDDFHKNNPLVPGLG